MFRNLASGKYLNIYGNDQVSSNRNVCQWEASADLSQLWRFYEDENLSKKLISVIKGSSGQLYGLNIYRSIHKNTDIYVETPTNIVDSSIDIECLGPISGANFSGEKVRIKVNVSYIGTLIIIKFQMIIALFISCIGSFQSTIYRRNHF